MMRRSDAFLGGVFAAAVIAQVIFTERHSRIEDGDHRNSAIDRRE